MKMIFVVYQRSDGRNLAAFNSYAEALAQCFYYKMEDEKENGEFAAGCTDYFVDQVPVF